MKMKHQDDKRNLEIENDKIKRELKESKNELKFNAHQIDLLQNTINDMHQLALESTECRPPSMVYALFLKERWYKFQLNRLKNQLPHDLETPKELADAQKHCSEEENDRLNEFYLHNYVVPHHYKWSPNPYLGYVQLRALISQWITHDNIQANEALVYEVVETQDELWTRAKPTRLYDVISSHQGLTSNSELIPILEEKQNEAIARFEEVIQERREGAKEECLARWK